MIDCLCDEWDAGDVGPETGRQRRYERKAPKVISPSDPWSAWTAKADVLPLALEMVNDTKAKTRIQKSLAHQTLSGVRQKSP